MEKIIIHCIYSAIVKALDEFERGEQKRGIVTLRQILPAAYKHSFEKPTAHALTP